MANGGHLASGKTFLPGKSLAGIAMGHFARMRLFPNELGRAVRKYNIALDMVNKLKKTHFPPTVVRRALQRMNVKFGLGLDMSVLGVLASNL